jgi:hypothetical protein
MGDAKVGAEVKRLYGLPMMSQDNFNRIAKENDIPVQWTGDANSNGLIDPSELSSSKKHLYVKAGAFTNQFKTIFGQMTQARRGEAIAAELKMTYREEISTNFDSWLRTNTTATKQEIANYKQGVSELLEFAKVIKAIYQKQVGFSDEMKAEYGTADDVEMISRYGHPWCYRDQSPFCVALPSLVERTNGHYPDGVSCDLADGSLMSLGNPFSIVEYMDNGFLVPIPYATVFEAKHAEATVHLEKAAAYFDKIPNEKVFAGHLLDLAATLRSDAPFPYIDSDKSWHAHGESDSIFFIRAGADEVGGDNVGDSCVLKARYHFNLALVNNSIASGAATKYNDKLQGWENAFSNLIGDPKVYQPGEVTMTFPKFYDILYQNGDDVGGPHGTNIGQTLPNWCGEDGMLEPCARRTMIYFNKTLLAYNDAYMGKYIMPLFASEHADDFDASVGLDSVTLHEIAHNFGPQMGKPKLDADMTYDAPFGKWRLTMEEMKAQTGSLYLAGEELKEARGAFKAGKLSKIELAKAETTYRNHIVYDMAWAVRMVMRATSSGKFVGGSYSRLAAMQIGYLTENGALSYDAKKGQWKVNFDNDVCLKGAEQLMIRTLKLYASGNLEEAEAFITKYISDEGIKLIHSDRIQEVAGKMPSVLFDYDVAGLDAE